MEKDLQLTLHKIVDTIADSIAEKLPSPNLRDLQPERLQVMQLIK